MNPINYTDMFDYIGFRITNDDIKDLCKFISWENLLYRLFNSKN